MTEMTILCLPEIALEKILSYLTYDEIATNRLVSKQFNDVCEGLLTKGFIQLEKKHSQIYRFVKALLPRRPSERRSNVVVSRYCEILQGMETRIRMLSVTYMRYIDQRLICFVPGKVLDEINRLLGLIESRFDPPHNNNQLLEELRDLSSMAMEHFDEHILPSIEKRDEAIQYKNVIPSTSKPPEEDVMRKELRKVHKRNRFFKSQISYLIASTRRLSEKWNRQNIRVKRQSSIIKDQSAKLQVQATHIENHEIVISEMKKKFEELQSNFVEIKSKWEFDAIQSAACISPAPTPPIQDPLPQTEPQLLTKNLRRMIQFETMRYRSNMMKKLSNPVQVKARNHKQKADNSRRRKYRSMIDVDIWRHRCPTSRLSYSLWSRDMKTKPEINLEKNQNFAGPKVTVLEEEINSKKPFVYKSIIKQRPSRVFPLTCLDLERKRKSYTCPDIPAKLSKNEQSGPPKAFDLIKKYLPVTKELIRSEVGFRNVPSTSNIHSRLEPRSATLKRKRAVGDE